MNSPDSEQLQTVSADAARLAEPNVLEPDGLAFREADHAHEQAMHKAEHGSIGRLLGSRSEKPGNVASIVILLCFVFIGLAFYRLDIQNMSDLFMKIVSASFSIIGLALGYLFGSSTRN